MTDVPWVGAIRPIRALRNGFLPVMIPAVKSICIWPGVPGHDDVGKKLSASATACISSRRAW